MVGRPSDVGPRAHPPSGRLAERRHGGHHRRQLGQEEAHSRAAMTQLAEGEDETSNCRSRHREFEDEWGHLAHRKWSPGSLIPPPPRPLLCRDIFSSRPGALPFKRWTRCCPCQHLHVFLPMHSLLPPVSPSTSRAALSPSFHLDLLYAANKELGWLMCSCYACHQ